MKTLVLLCDSYPLTAGEFFLDDEIKIIHPHFDKIHVLIKEQDEQELNRFIPNNLQITKYKTQITTKDKFKALPEIFTALFISELFRAIFKFKIAPKPILFKIMFMDIVRSNQIISELKKLISNQNIDLNNTIFYSYWHDYKALSLARMSKRNSQIRTIARAHRWDIYFYANEFPYLPYKNFILNNLTQTISISHDGVKYFNKLLGTNLADKISISKLGKINIRNPKIEKSNAQILFCSCSTIISVKRVEKIIDVLSTLNIENLKWIHFGDGILRGTITAYASEKLKNINFEFRGIVPNNEILDFYASNYVDLFINLSESEGIPVSIMESLSAGIPVLATNVGGTSEAVNNKNGFLIPKDFDVNEVAKIIENYLKSTPDNQIQYRQNAHNFWQENFEATKNYTQFANELLTL
ncbi:MAG: glycosyltransferase [Bacteroidales bacterium]|nr:glycosyltransferase [Bacteroidales bacterium]